MDLLRPEIAALEQYGITRVALPRIDDPDVIALWFGEGDLATEAFIRDAAKQSLGDGETFYPRAAASEASSVSAADRRAGALRNRSGLQGSFRASVSVSGESRSSAVSLCMVQSQPVDSRQSGAEGDAIVQVLKRITLDPTVMGGKACIRGLRVTVGTVLGLLAAGRTRDEILEAYPYLEPEDIDEALAYAAWRVEEREVPLARS